MKSTPGGLADFLIGHPAARDTPVLYGVDDELTLSALMAAARVLAGRLGPVGGQPVACVVDEGVRAVTAMFATWLAGGVYVPVNGRLTAREVAAHLAASRPAVVVAGPGTHVPDGFDTLREREPGVWTAACAPDRGEPASFGPDAAIVIRTSGTTGASKPVVLTHEGVRDGIDTVIAKLRGGKAGGRAPMPNLIPSSQALWAGAWNLLFAFRVGAPAILMDRFEPVAYAALVRRFGIRSTVLAPAMMAMLVEHPDVVDLGPLRLVRSVTAPLAPAQARAFHGKFGVDVLNSYGQTELGSEVAGWTAADVRAFGAAKLGAVGRAHPGVDIRIAADDGTPLPPGETGEIWIRSPFATGDAEGRVDAEGHLRTGDLGRLDADGFLWIEGRVSDMVNRGGLKIVPQEVEDVLRGHPEVADACVAGVPDARLGEVPVAWIRPRAGTTPDEAALAEYARRELAGYKVPVAFRFVADFPRTEIGKVLRRELVAADPLTERERERNAT
ncbi:fatty acid--CoA ligase family protein [Actinocorallia sp. A-T 12471]|uniref:class I adenylate-forming enzyme family protein n=1 Tax=Actinocorallia sp. A-T 12471 TaxID=3089813 RepID=UPI0029CB9251|nr:fatty acid--CoA ligase family protein [Actinocorallia sp. A-T 12471]MDX6740977.1 fatty acid--CoA ligase family protein [Actinocorallia sp. A-T 12471]